MALKSAFHIDLDKTMAPNVSKFLQNARFKKAKRKSVYL